MTIEMKPHEILAAIRERITPTTREWFCGVSGDIEQELIVLAQRKGLDAAMAQAERMADPEYRV